MGDDKPTQGGGMRDDEIAGRMNVVQREAPEPTLGAHGEDMEDGEDAKGREGGRDMHDGEDVENVEIGEDVKDGEDGEDGEALNAIKQRGELKKAIMK